MRMLTWMLWFAAGCGSVRNDTVEPQDAPSNSDSSPPDAMITSYRVFISTASFNGNLGGLTGADQKCQTAADARGFGGLWRAYLSTTTTHARDRIPSNGRFVRVSGTVIANDRDDLLDGTLVAPILHDETGTELTPNRAWTGSSSNGTLRSGANCNDWTLGTTTTVPGLIGDASVANAQWTDLQNSGCGGTQRLFCCEQ